MKLKVITSIAIEKNKKFLVLKRSKHDTMPGLWEFPGGKVEAGETLKNSAEREVLEEAGVNPKRLDYRGYSERFKEDRDEDTGYHTIVHHFYCNDFTGEIKISEEHEEFKWKSKEEILSMKEGKDIGSDTAIFFNLKFG